MCARRGKQEREQGEDVLGSRSIKAARACILNDVIKMLGIREESPGTRTVSVGCGVAGKSRLPLAHTFMHIHL